MQILFLRTIAVLAIAQRLKLSSNASPMLIIATFGHHIWCPINRCCNTCEELKTMYLRKGWSLTQILRDSEQCLRDKTNPFAHVRAGEGCRVTGNMVLMSRSFSCA